MKRQTIQSRKIHSWGYDPQSQCLEVEYRWKTIVRYFTIPTEMIQAFEQAESKGSFLSKHIERKFPFAKLSPGEDDTPPAAPEFVEPEPDSRKDERMFKRDMDQSRAEEPEPLTTEDRPTVNLIAQSIIDRSALLFNELAALDEEQRIDAINGLKRMLHIYSPMKSEPVDCVLWIHHHDVTANDYNPNSVAPPEMRLLEHSILEDGYTQPIVTWKRENGYEVIDGFHRHRVGCESPKVRKRIHGYLPVTVINAERADRSDRIAATIRHNRARGKHKVEAMSDIVIELKRRNWSDEKVGRELGMDADEVLRLCQITGLAEVFTDSEFSKAWDIEYEEPAAIGSEILSDIAENEVTDSKRIHHTWEKWECFRAGFYEEQPPNGMTQDEGEEVYRVFLSDLESFEAALQFITSEWKYSCEHYLTNERMNRIAWLGQASVAQALGIPSCCRGGYNRLTDEQRVAADQLALSYLNKWLAARGEPPVEYETALSRTEMDLY